MDIEKQQEPVAVATPQPIGVAPVAATAATAHAAPPMVAEDQYKSGAPADVPMYQQQKVGAKCCGCCCDYRRATIIMSIISLIFACLSIIGAFADGDGATEAQGDVESVDFEKYQDEMQTTELVTGILGAIMSASALYGAVTYNKIMVAVPAVYSLLAYIATSIKSAQAWDTVQDESGNDVDVAPGSFVIGAVIVLAWVYPYIGFCIEVHKGIMSHETYPREEYSCCCTSNRRY